MDTSLAIEVVKHAIHSQCPSQSVTFHSDLGSQYTSVRFREYFKNNNIIHSFSGKSTPYDNACIESFHASFKKEEVY